MTQLLLDYTRGHAPTIFRKVIELILMTIKIPNYDENRLNDALEAMLFDPYQLFDFRMMANILKTNEKPTLMRLLVADARVKLHEKAVRDGLARSGTQVHAMEVNWIMDVYKEFKKQYGSLIEEGTVLRIAADLLVAQGKLPAEVLVRSNLVHQILLKLSVEERTMLDVPLVDLAAANYSALRSGSFEEPFMWYGFQIWREINSNNVLFYAQATFLEALLKDGSEADVLPASLDAPEWLGEYSVHWNLLLEAVFDVSGQLRIDYDNDWSRALILKAMEMTLKGVKEAKLNDYIALLKAMSKEFTFK